MARVANRDARVLVTSRLPFTGNNTYSRTLTDGSYAVFSYGEHWPLYVWWQQTNQWLGNANKYSRTTTKHAGQLRPLNTTIRHLVLDEMLTLVRFCDSYTNGALLAKLLNWRAPVNNDHASPASLPATSKRRLLPLTG